MPTSRNDVRVICPFYRYDETVKQVRSFKITCEGLTDDSTIVLAYSRKQPFEIQLETFCCRYYERCEIYRVLMDKYEEGDNGKDGVSA